MSEYATSTPRTTSPLLTPRTYWIVSGYALAAASLLGFAVNAFAGNHAGIQGLIVFDWLHNSLHAALAGAAFTFAYAPLRPRITKTFTILFGFVYGGLGVVGLGLGEWDLVPGLHVELAENLIHLTLGAWALAAGFLSRP